MKKYLIIFFLLLIPSGLIFYYGLYLPISSLKETKTVEVKEEIVVNIEDDVMLYNKLLTECFEKYNYDVFIDCEKKIKESFEDVNKVKEDKNNFLINGILGLMIIALNTQLAIFIYAYSQKEKISETYFHLSDWAINSPPMLGVLGTIISFALLVGNMEEGNIQDVFTKSFFDAAITTIIGGLIYVFNLLLKVKIHTHIRWVT
jgi:flagellar motor component MotA